MSRESLDREKTCFRYSRSFVTNACTNIPFLLDKHLLRSHHCSNCCYTISFHHERSMNKKLIDHSVSHFRTVSSIFHRMISINSSYIFLSNLLNDMNILLDNLIQKQMVLMLFNEMNNSFDTGISCTCSINTFTYPLNCHELSYV